MVGWKSEATAPPSECQFTRAELWSELLIGAAGDIRLEVATVAVALEEHTAMAVADAPALRGKVQRPSPCLERLDTDAQEVRCLAVRIRVLVCPEPLFMVNRDWPGPLRLQTLFRAPCGKPLVADSDGLCGGNVRVCGVIGCLVAGAEVGRASCR